MYLSVLSCQKPIHHYVFFGMDRERIMEESFLSNRGVEGAQLKYSWKELEPEKGRYDFKAIRKDLLFLTSHGKRLFIQLQDVTFDTVRVFVPEYILSDTSYHGGVHVQYLFEEGDVVVRQDGWVPRRWDPAVSTRFHSLLYELGAEFDGSIEGINLPETAIDFGTTGKYHPVDFTYEGYVGAIRRNMGVLKKSFERSTVIQYANFMPGEWLPWEDHGYLQSLFILAAKEDIGMGGPDIKIWKRAQMNHSYRFLKEYSDSISTGVAIQEGNYEEINPKTGMQVTIPELFDFGNTYLGLDYIFWSTQEPYYSKDVLPFLKNHY